MASYLIILDREKHEATGVLDQHRLGLEAPIHLFPSHLRDLHASLELVLLALCRLKAEEDLVGRGKNRAIFSI